jgi:hypothetical protein
MDTSKKQTTFPSFRGEFANSSAAREREEEEEERREQRIKIGYRMSGANVISYSS